MSNYSKNYQNAKENYLKELKNEYKEWLERFHKRFQSWVVRLFGDEYVYLNIWAKAWDCFADAKCIKINLNEGDDIIYICEEEADRNSRDDDNDWYRCCPDYSLDPIGNYITLIDLIKDKLSEYGETK